MNKILFEGERPIIMHVLKKCVDKFPKWQDVRSYVPLLVAGTAGLALILINASERKETNKNQQKTETKSV